MLRLIVLLLLLLNALYYSWGQGWLLPYGWGPAQQREPQRLAQQVHPEALVVLNAREAASVVLPASPSRVCLQSGDLDEARAQALRPVLQTQLPEDVWTLDEQVVPARWMVYMGKFASNDDLVKKRNQLSELKVKFEVIEASALAPGLSLGAFPSEVAAAAYLESLVKRGVRTAKVAQAQPPSASYRLRLPALDPAHPALEAIKAAAPGIVLQDCPELAAN